MSPTFTYRRQAFSSWKNIRILNGSEVRIENSVTRVTVQHHEACWVMTNSYSKWRNFQFAPNDHYRFYFLHILPSTIAFRLEYILFYQFYSKITTCFDQEMFGLAPVQYLASKRLAETWHKDVKSGKNVKIIILTSCTRVVLHPR